MSENTPDTVVNIDLKGLQSLVDQIVASNLTNAILSRMETYKAKEPGKDYTLEENFNPLVDSATSDVVNMYTCIWGALEKISKNAEGIGQDTPAL